MHQNIKVEGIKFISMMIQSMEAEKAWKAQKQYKMLMKMNQYTMFNQINDLKTFQSCFRILLNQGMLKLYTL